MSEFLRAWPVEDIRIRSGDGRTVEAYLAVFNTPADVRDEDGVYREQIAPTGFAKTLTERAGRLSIFYNHGRSIDGFPSDRHSMPIGVPVEITPDTRGVRVVDRYHRTELADEVLEGIRSGAIRGYSFSGAFVKSDPRVPRGGFRRSRDGSLTLVTRTEVALREYGPTPFPNYADAAITAVRADRTLGALLAAPPAARLQLLQQLQGHHSTEPEPSPSPLRTEPANGPMSRASTPLGRCRCAPASGLRASPEVWSLHMRRPVLVDQPVMRPIGYRRDGRPIYPILGAAPFGGRATEIRTRMATISTDLAALEAAEDDEEHRLRFEALTEEWDSLDEELKPLAVKETKLAEVRARMAAEANQEPGFAAPDQSGTRVRSDPFRELPERISMLGGTEIRTRAESALKVYEEEIPKAATELVGKMLEFDPTNSTAEFVLATAAPAYRSAFLKWLRDPATGPNTWTAEEAAAYQRTYAARAALSLTAANGGYLVPFTLDPTIILTNSGSANPYRQIATVKTTSTNDWNGVTSAGVNAEWTAEGVEAADASPTVGPLKVTPQKADAYVFGSYEVLGDSDFGQQLPELIADAKDRLEEAAFAVGTGTGQPKGVIPAGTAFAPTGTAAGPNIASVYGLQNTLPARWRGPRSRQAWLAALATINALRQLPKFTGSTTSMVDDSGPTPTMLGKPLLESSSISSTFANTQKVLAYLDASQYYIVDRIGVQMIYDPLVLGANRRPSGQGAYFAFWRTGADAAVATAIRVLTLTT